MSKRVIFTHKAPAPIGPYSQAIKAGNFIFGSGQISINPKNNKLEGKNIERYFFSQAGWLNYIPSEHYNPMFPELFENNKIMFIRIVKDRLRFAFDNNGFYNSHTVINCVKYNLLENANHVSARKALRENDLELSKQYDYFYLLGILNSSLINWYFKNFISDNVNFYPNDAKSLPIRAIDFSNSIDKKCHLQMTKYVDRMLELHKRLDEVKTPYEKTNIRNPCGGPRYGSPICSFHWE